MRETSSLYQTDSSLFSVLSFDHDDEFSSRADSRLSKLSQVVKVRPMSSSVTVWLFSIQISQAKSFLEKNKKDGSITCSLMSDSSLPRQIELRKTKSFSASNLFNKQNTRGSSNLVLVRQAQVNHHQLSSSRVKNFHSLDDEGHNTLHTPRISIDDTDSNSSSYHARWGRR